MFKNKKIFLSIACGVLLSLTACGTNPSESNSQTAASEVPSVTPSVEPSVEPSPVPSEEPSPIPSEVPSVEESVETSEEPTPDSYTLVNFDEGGDVGRVWGGWTLSGNGGSVDDHTNWNEFVTLNIKGEENEIVYFKADISLTEGFMHIGGGIEDLNDPGRGWYGLILDAGANIIRWSAEGTGTMGGNHGIHQYNLPSNVSISDTHTYEGVFYPTGRLVSYFDGVLASDCYDSAFKQGYIGLAIYNGVGTFSNVKYRKEVTTDLVYEIPENTVYRAADYGTGYNWGSWNFSADCVNGQSGDPWNMYSMTSIKQTTSQDLTIEADIEIIEGVACAIVFGLDQINDPGLGGYFVSFNADKTVRATSEGNKAEAIGVHDENKVNVECEDDFTYVHIKVVAKGSGELSYYFNNEFAYTFNVTGYTGGFVGFSVFQASASFTNIRVSLLEAK